MIQSMASSVTPHRSNHVCDDHEIHVDECVVYDPTGTKGERGLIPSGYRFVVILRSPILDAGVAEDARLAVVDNAVQESPPGHEAIRHNHAEDESPFHGRDLSQRNASFGSVVRAPKYDAHCSQRCAHRPQRSCQVTLIQI